MCFHIYGYVEGTSLDLRQEVLRHQAHKYTIHLNTEYLSLLNMIFITEIGLLWIVEDKLYCISSIFPKYRLFMTFSQHPIASKRCGTQSMLPGLMLLDGQRKSDLSKIYFQSQKHLNQLYAHFLSIAFDLLLATTLHMSPLPFSTICNKLNIYAFIHFILQKSRLYLINLSGPICLSTVISTTNDHIIPNAMQAQPFISYVIP